MWKQIEYAWPKTTEWSEKKNPAEDNLPRKKLVRCFYTEKLSALLVSWENQFLPLRNLPPPQKSSIPSKVKWFARSSSCIQQFSIFISTSQV